jgi:hypothetical protein
MKYIITESQYKRLIENETGDRVPNWLRRRLNNFEENLYKIAYENNPNDFSDEFEFADTMLTWAVNDSRLHYNDEYGDDTFNLLKDMYGDTLFDIYYSLLNSENEDNEMFDI